MKRREPLSVSQDKTCGECVYFDWVEGTVGRCRQSAPTIGWPDVQENDWCGDFQPANGQQMPIETSITIPTQLVEYITRNNSLGPSSNQSVIISACSIANLENRRKYK